MSKPIIEEMNSWPRNLSTLRGGGLSTLRGGGMSTLRGDGASSLRDGGLSTLRYGGLSTLRGGGLSSLSGGGMSTASADIYFSNIPPWPHFLRELESRGYDRASEMIRNCLPIYLWPENFFK